MWGLRSRKRSSDPSLVVKSPPFFELRQEIELTNFVTNYAKATYIDHDAFALFAGVVFAIQQDFKLARGQNLWDSTNIIDSIIEDLEVRLPMRGRGRSPEETAQICTTLDSIMRMNADFVSKYRDNLRENPPAHLDPSQLRAHALLAGLRQRAAALWLLTIMGYKEDTALVPLAATNTWIMLSFIRLEEVIPNAKIVTGGHFEDVSCSEFAASDWPKLLT